MALDCKIYQDLIPLYITHSLSKESTTFLEAHLTTCPHCTTYLHTTKHTFADSSSTNQYDLPLTLKALQKQRNLTQWAFLACGIFLSILFTLNNNLFQNIIFLPLIGIIGYLLTKKTVSLPIITSLLLTLTILFKDAMTACFDGLFGYLFYLIIFFFLTLLGTLCGYLLYYTSKNFKTQSTYHKLCALLLWFLIIAISLLALNFSNAMNGNPLIACYAQFQMKHYLEENYPDMTANLNNNHYNYKSGYYTASARFYTEEITHNFNVYYRHGQIWDNYFTSYLEDQPTEYRLGQEASAEIDNLLTTYHIPFLSIECELDAAKGEYNNTPYNKEIITSPLRLHIYRLTETKQTYDEFANWCETIRTLLLSSNYSVNELTFESDPYFMANRLSLTLRDEAILLPIQSLSDYDDFIDYSTLNDLDNETTFENVSYGKQNFYYNKELSTQITSLLRSAGYQSAYATAQANPNNELDLFIYWSGNRISIDHFSENVIDIMHFLRNQHFLSPYTLMPLTLQYGWGTEKESYMYTVYSEQLDQLSTDKIIQTLLDKENMK